ncbi:hypothetical protein DYU05_01260 [Mucilaginibacter terrenus]|uniref:histidine kinase n=1 Tax=Mucilaginibacter terrenus TaxID=2482727 RepID=A0A3E2NTK9_9SPHI|nr:PAS domain-containing sensor histidine kinase [Mucilaginibacter terrenus]RFZ84287.1 hypothetical protein DYU05_01260 [Mucilaginibacter terrenus]
MDQPVQPLSNDTLLQVLALSKDATAVYVSEDIYIRFANDAMINFWGKDRSVIGKTLEDAVPELEGQPFIDLLKNVWRTGQTYVAENTPANLVVNGELQTFYFDFEYRAILDEQGKTYCLLHTARDVTSQYFGLLREQNLSAALSASNADLMNTNQELAALTSELMQSNELLSTVNDNLTTSERQLQFTIDAAELATWDLDPNTFRFTGNDRLKSWFGLAADDEIELERATNQIPVADRKKVDAAIAEALRYESGGNYDVEYAIINPVDSKTRYVRAKGKAEFNANKQPTRFSGILQDVTVEKLEEQRKDDFISIASHELKTPITTLKASLQLMDKIKNVPGQAMTPKLIMQSRKSVERVSILVDELLNVAKLQHGELNLNKTPFVLSQLLNAACNPIAIMGKHKISISGELELEVNADEHRIDQVITNLLNNAVKYAPDSEVISLSIDLIDGMVKVSVTDTGPGIPKEKIPHLFDRYYRVDSAGYQVSGLGLGLYISSEIVKRHGGTIHADSELGKGTTFWFTLPL